MQTSWYEQQLARLRLKAKDEAKDKKKRMFSPLIPAVRVGARLRAARAAAAGLSTEASPKSAGKTPRRRLVDKLTPKSPGAAMRRLRASLGKLGDKSPKTPSTPSLYLRDYRKKVLREKRTEDMYHSIMHHPTPSQSEARAARAARGGPRLGSRGHLLLDQHDSKQWLGLCGLDQKQRTRGDGDGVREEKEVVEEEELPVYLDRESTVASSVSFYDDGVDVTDSATAALEDKPTNTSIVTVVTARDADMATG